MNRKFLYFRIIDLRTFAAGVVGSNDNTSQFYFRGERFENPKVFLSTSCKVPDGAICFAMNSSFQTPSNSLFVITLSV